MIENAFIIVVDALGLLLVIYLAMNTTREEWAQAAEESREHIPGDW